MLISSKSWKLLSVFTIATIILSGCESQPPTPNYDLDSNVPVDPANLTAISQIDHFKGSKNSKVVLIEYSDLQCPACAAYYPLVKQLAAEYGDSIAIVYRHLPLIQIHRNAVIAAFATEAAARQDKFWEMHDKLFDTQTSWSTENDPLILFTNYAEELGMKPDKFQADMESEIVRQKVSIDFASGNYNGVQGTPSFFINGQKIQNPRNYEQFKKVIDVMLS